MDIVAQFLELHKIDWETYQLCQEQKLFPERLKRRREKISKIEKQIAEDEEDEKKKIIYMREQEKSLTDLDTAIAKNQVYLNQAKNNREYETLVEEINKKKTQKDLLEEKILEMIEENEQRQVERSAQKLELERQIKDCDQYAKETEATLNEIEQRLLVLKEERGKKREKIKALAPEFLEGYEHIVKSKTGKALAPVEDSACGFCHVRLSANDLSILGGRKMIFCRDCERLLYKPL